MDAVKKMLARFLWPFVLWMAVGWSLFPTMAARLLEMVNEDPNTRLLWFGYPIAVICLAFGIILMYYGYSD